MHRERLACVFIVAHRNIMRDTEEQKCIVGKIGTETC